MPPKKAKEIKEPDVVVPDGNPVKGKALFDEQCSACHAIEVTNLLYGRVMTRLQLLQYWEVSSEGRLAQLSSTSARL